MTQYFTAFSVTAGIWTVYYVQVTLNMYTVYFVSKKWGIKKYMLQYVVLMITLKCKVPSLVHYIVKISKRKQENILARVQKYFFQF